MAKAENCSTDYFDGCKLGKAHKKFLWLAAAAYFFDQMDLLTFGFVAPIIKEQWGLTMGQVATMNSLSFWGMCVGGFFGGWLANKIGRKPGLLTCIGIFSLASLVSGFTNSIPVFYAMRFMVGFGVIGMVVVAMVYMSEMMPSESRGRYQSLTIACGTIGIPFGALLARILIPLTEHSWRIVFFVGGLSILMIPLGLAWLKESPRWLVNRGRYAEAEQIVFDCVGKKVDFAGAVTNCAEQEISTLGTIKLMFGPALRKRTTVVFVLVLGVTLGTFYIANFIATFLVDLGWETSAALSVIALGSFGTPIGDIFSSFITDKGGRKTPIIICFIVSFGLSCLLGLAVNSEALFTASYFLKSAFASASMTMMWTYLAENYPTRIRSNATGIVFSTARAANALAMATVPFCYATFGFLGINVINGLMFLIPGVLAIFLGDKTAQKSLEQIEQEVFGNN